MGPLDPEVEAAVDIICALGCELVSERITVLRSEEFCPECENLDPDQRLALLRELESILAVYESG